MRALKTFISSPINLVYAETHAIPPHAPVMGDSAQKEEQPQQGINSSLGNFIERRYYGVLPRKEAFTRQLSEQNKSTYPYSIRERVNSTEQVFIHH